MESPQTEINPAKICCTLRRDVDRRPCGPRERMLDVESATNEGWINCLWIAAYNGQVELVEALVNVRCDEDKADDDHGFGPLYVAAHKGHGELVEALLKGGCDVDRADDDGATPLLVAAECGHGGWRR